MMIFKRLIPIYFASLLLLHARLAWASESQLSTVIAAPSGTPRQDFDEYAKALAVNVRVEVEDFGIVRESYTEIMPQGSTTADALSIRHKITSGKICADPSGVLTVDGFGDYKNGDYWVVSVNGDYAHTNAHTQLKAGDQVKWQRIKVDSE